ncbi:hypothetical protein niasHS_014275 [Heterodera schachtii]|uniref:Uncharacterized protein n=1 Tax=Heterodera schachtii TaxID=97005 RepID=A0ABD2IBC1_HETSC
MVMSPEALAPFPPPFPQHLPHLRHLSSSATTDAANVNNNYNYNANDSSNFNIMDANNETHSIDAVIDRVHRLASAIHDLAHSAGDKVQAIGARGEQTLANFDANFAAIQSDVQHVVQNASARVEQAVPMSALVTVGICLAVLLALLGLWLLISAITELSSIRRRRRRRRSSDQRQQQQRRTQRQNDEEIIGRGKALEEE